ncbi:MAG: carboxypeptidase M32 [Chloroflexi bacterium]|nr:carboxypeptidase M32 [Chloroflexota bacterium]
MSEKLVRLKEILGEVSDLTHAAAVLEWDQNVGMPAGGAEARGQQLSTLAKIAQEKSTSDELGRLLEDLQKEYPEGESEESAMIRVASRNYEKARRVPAEFVAERALVTTQAFEAWVVAKKKSDFSVFHPHLEKIVELVRRYITFFPPADHPYDVLLDDYERGLKTAEVKSIFQDLRLKQVELIRRIGSVGQVRDDFLHAKYNEQKLWKFGERIIGKFGYDWNRGRQDQAPHPFETSFSVNDVRITNRFEADHPMATLFGAMHEAGHAMYEQGINPSYERTPLEGGASLAVHESQSRLWENLVGRSMPFWEHFYPELKKTFPAQLDGITLKSFYKAINKVEPSLIRVNADEATYNLHVMLRLELEISMVEGAVAVRDLPQMWNEKMREYLGVIPPNDAKGVLQDVHWSGGSIGYFSTYALGNLISAQWAEAIRKDIRDLDDRISKGKFDDLLGWLRGKIHVHGKRYEPQALVQKVTGAKIDAGPFMSYLEDKFGGIYGL